MAKDDSSKRSAETRALDLLIKEAKDRDPFVVSSTSSSSSSSNKPEIDLDWSKIEAKVMAAVNEEAPRLVQRESTRMRAMRAGAVVLAAAAAIALYVRSAEQNDAKTAAANNATTNHEVANAVDSTPASSLVGVAGEVRIGSNVVEPGFVLHANDSIATSEHARATFERTRKVAWLVEGGESTANVRVKSAGEPLILGLESGAIEAQVVPVPVGEAFAIDVASTTGSVVRVAVHGTHLRVARAGGNKGNRITVDLTEGVVSIGVPPKTGVTYGTLVTAPAHVELDASDLSTIRVDHNLNVVRSAIALNPFGSIEASSNSPSTPQKLALAPTAAKEPSSLLPAPPRATPPAPAAPAKDRDENPEKLGEQPTPAPAKAAPPRDAIAAAVRDCAVARSRSAARPGNDVTHVTVTSTLKLRVSNNGVVESAQFNPPLPAEIQSCAAQVIYKTKLDSESGLVTIPIEFEFSR